MRKEAQTASSSTSREVSQSPQKYRESLQRVNREKQSCEYYNEGANLEDGDLPSLSLKIRTPYKSYTPAVVTPPRSATDANRTKFKDDAAPYHTTKWSSQLEWLEDGSAPNDELAFHRINSIRGESNVNTIEGQNLRPMGVVDDEDGNQNGLVVTRKEHENKEYAQLDQLGDVIMIRRNEVGEEHIKDSSMHITSVGTEPKPDSDGSPMPMDEARGHMLEKNRSWSAPNKKAYLRALAQRAKEKFQRKKDVEDQPECLLNNPVRKGSKLAMSRSHNKTIDDKKDSLNDKEGWTLAEKVRSLQSIKYENPVSQEAASNITSSSRNSATIHSKKDALHIHSKEFSRLTLNDTPATNKNLDYLHSTSFQPISPGLGANGSIMSPKASSRQVSDSGNEMAMSKPNKTKSVIGPNGTSSKFAGSTLSNIRKKPEVHKVIDAKVDDGLDLDMDRYSGEQRPTQSYGTIARRSVLALHRNGSIIGNSKKKKDSKKGAKWHQITDHSLAEDRYFTDVHRKSLGEDNNESKISSFNENTQNNVSTEEVSRFAPNRNDLSIGSQPLFYSLQLDPSHHLSDVSMLDSSVGCGDGLSIASGASSVHTTTTNETSLSKSTRVRHQGAAKNRVTDSVKKSANLKNSSGWYQSMKTVVEANNCEWNTKDGFVDYAPPEETKEIATDVMHIGRLNSKMSTRKLSPELHVQSVNDEDYSNIPFPSNWEKDREEMIGLRQYGNGDASAFTEVVRNKHQKRKIKLSRSRHTHSSRVTHKFQRLDDD